MFQNSNKPKVSIIMNCYNGEKYLNDALQSILNQSYKNWELIFWDNLSIDNSKEIFHLYKDDRFKYYKADKHTLLSEARNKALNYTNGDYVAFLDVDDFWEEKKLETQINIFQKDKKISVVYCNYYNLNEKLNKKSKLTEEHNIQTGHVFKKLLKFYSVGISTLVLKKEVFQEYKFNNKFHIIGDFDLVMKLAKKFKFGASEKCLSNYRIHENNEIFIKKKMYVEELRIWYDENKKDLEYIKEFIDFKTFIDEIEIKYLILEKKIKEAYKMLKKYPTGIKKIKYLIALILPKKILKKIIS